MESLKLMLGDAMDESKGGMNFTIIIVCLVGALFAFLIASAVGN